MGRRYFSEFLDLLRGRMPLKKVQWSLPINPDTDGTSLSQLLRDVIERRDAEEAEAALALVDHFEAAEDCIEELCDLMDAGWHRRHEDLAHTLQWTRDPRAIGCLSRTALSHYPYRDYDDYGALASQCMYALRAIGTPEAILAIEHLVSADDPVVSEYAVWHLAQGPMRHS